MVEKNKIKIKEKTLTDFISEIVVESQARILAEAPQLITEEKRMGKCQSPKPWKVANYGPEMKVGDFVANGLFRVKNFSVEHGQANTRVYMTNDQNIHVFADEILSQWDGAQPFNFSMELVRAHDSTTPSFEQWADENPEKYDYMPYALLEDLGFRYCGPVKKGKKSSCVGGEWLFTHPEDKDSWAVKQKKYIRERRKQIDFRNEEWAIFESLLPEGYDWSSIGKKGTGYYKGKIIIDGKKVVQKFGGDWKKMYPWVFVDLNQTGILMGGAGGAGKAYYGSDSNGTSGKHSVTLRQGSEHLNYVKNGTTIFRENYDMDVIDVILTQDGETQTYGRTQAKNDVSAGISITVSNNPEVWQLATAMMLKEDVGMFQGFSTPEQGEWARRNCVQIAKGSVGFDITNEKQNRKYSDYTVGKVSNKTTQLKYFTGKSRGVTGFRVHFYIKYNLGIQGEMQRELWLEEQPYDKYGNWEWEKSEINWKNWSLHTWLEVGAVAILIVGAAFTGGATLWLGAAYIAINTANALIYFAEGNYGMGGLILLFDFIPGGHLAKGLGVIFKSATAPAKAITRMTQATKILYSGGFKKFNIVLKQLGGKTDNLVIARALAETGDAGLKAMQKEVRNIQARKITEKMGKEFIEELSKTSPKLAAKLTPEMAQEVLKQQRNRMARYYDNVINGGTLPIVMGEAVVLLTLYDTNMVAQLLHEFLWNTPLKDRDELPSFSKSVTNRFNEMFAGETWLDEWWDWIVDETGLDRDQWFTVQKTGGGMSDIVNSTPCSEEDKEREALAKTAFSKSIAHLQTKFYPWCIGDYYNWQGKGPALQYCAATSTDTFELEGAKLPQNCKYISSSHYGVGVKHGFRSPEFNRAMKKDWVNNGWRPGYCVETSSAENSTASVITGEDAIIDMNSYELLMQGVKIGWDSVFYAASENFKKLTTSEAGPGEYLKISINKQKYTITSKYNKKFADKVCRLPQEEYNTLFCVLLYYRDLTSAPTFDINPMTGQPILNSKALPGCLGTLSEVDEAKLLKPSGS
jgi:hypothetical protein